MNCNNHRKIGCQGWEIQKISNLRDRGKILCDSDEWSQRISRKWPEGIGLKVSGNNLGDPTQVLQCFEK